MEDGRSVVSILGVRNHCMLVAELLRSSVGIAQRFRYRAAEVVAELLRSSVGIAQRFRYTDDWSPITDYFPIPH